MVVVEGRLLYSREEKSGEPGTAFLMGMWDAVLGSTGNLLCFGIEMTVAGGRHRNFS